VAAQGAAAARFKRKLPVADRGAGAHPPRCAYLEHLPRLLGVGATTAPGAEPRPGPYRHLPTRTLRTTPFSL
jgi:hypothetical protein